MDLRDVAFLLGRDYPGGVRSLAPRVGKNATSLSHELNGTGGAKLGLLDAEAMTLLTGDLRILQAFALNCGQMLVPLPSTGDGADDCMHRLAAMAKEFGDLCTVVASDLSDSCITDNELARIDRECGELMASVHALRESLARRNQQSKPVREARS